MSRDTDTRTVTLVDIPLVSRLGDKAAVLDNEIGFTKDANGPSGMIISTMLMPQRHTLVARSSKRQVVGQFRLKPDDTNAQIIYIAPHLQADFDDTVWMHLLDAMAREAGKHGAHALIAEVEELDSLFETMRNCGFAVYARQQVWRRPPGEYLPDEDAGQELTIREMLETDVPGVDMLIAHVIPALMQQIATPSSEHDGWVYHKEDRIVAYVAAAEGKNGIYLTPYFRPEHMNEVGTVLAHVIRRLDKGDKLPIYVCIRRYQDWMADSLETLAFEPGPRQAVMVKHITAGIRQTTFKTVPNGMAALAGSGKPPTNRLTQVRYLE